AASMVCASLGGLVWHQGVQVQAQVPAPIARPPFTDKIDQGKDVAELERQLEALQVQVQAKQKELARMRQGDALDQIEAALKKLKQANAGDPQRSAAIAEFEQAFGKLKEGLAGGNRKTRVRFLEKRNFLESALLTPIVT